MKKNKDKNSLPEKSGESRAEKNQPAGNGDDKINITKSVFEVSRELQQQRLKEQEEKQAELERQYAEREKKKREAYDRRILEEKKELIRLKQGLIEESETIHEEQETAAVLTPWQKVQNFFYHSKWWLGIGIFIVLIVAILIHSLISKPKPDMIVLLICDNNEIGETEGLQNYLTGFAEDFNGNGKLLVSVYYMPLSDNTYSNYANGTDNKLTVEMQSADSVIVIAGQKFCEEYMPEETLMDLEELFPDNPHVEGYAFKLSDTVFAQRIGVDPQYVTDDLFLGIRKPSKLMYADENEMQETYDKDFTVFKKIIEDLSK